MKEVFLQFHEIHFQKKEEFSLPPNFPLRVRHSFVQLMEQALQV